MSDSKNRLAEFISKCAFSASPWIVRNRVAAADKTRKYEWRLDSDRAVARDEAHMQKLGRMLMRALGVTGYEEPTI